MSKTLVDSEDISTARVVAGDPFFGLIEDAYREFKAAPPSHLGICTCGMCMGPDRSRRVAKIAARLDIGRCLVVERQRQEGAGSNRLVMAPAAISRSARGGRGVSQWGRASFTKLV